LFGNFDFIPTPPHLHRGLDVADDCLAVAQFAYWQHTQLIIDVVKGRGSGFSLEAPEGVRFLTRSRLFTEEEVKALAVNGVGSDNHPRR
jgi:hypothetical protein